MQHGSNGARVDNITIYSIDADAFIATTFSAQQRRLFGTVRVQHGSDGVRIDRFPSRRLLASRSFFALQREHFFLSSLHWKDQLLRIGSDYVHGAVAQAVSARAEHAQDAQAAPAVDAALDAPVHVTGVRVKLCVVAR